MLKKNNLSHIYYKNVGLVKRDSFFNYILFNTIIYLKNKSKLVGRNENYRNICLRMRKIN